MGLQHAKEKSDPDLLVLDTDAVLFSDEGFRCFGPSLLRLALPVPLPHPLAKFQEKGKKRGEPVCGDRELERREEAGER